MISELLQNERALVWVGAILYALAFGLGAAVLWRDARLPKLLMLAVVCTGFAFQTLGLYARGLQTHSCPLGNAFEIIQFVTWSLIVIYLIIGTAFRVSLLGFFTAGLASTLSLVSLAIPAWDSELIIKDKPNPWVEAHASTAIFSYGVFALLAVTSLMYILQNHGLKHKRFKGLFRLLPSIVQTEEISRRLLLVGTVVLTFSLLLGAVHWSSDEGEIQTLKLAFTVGVWMAYLIAVLVHYSNKLIGTAFAKACLLLFVLAMLSLWPVDAARGGDGEVIEHTPPIEEVAP